jgi:probable HAF family extracellular repeat protein
MCGQADGQTVIRELGVTLGGAYTSGAAISADGSVATGFGGAFSGPNALRWSGVSGPQNLGVLGGGWYSFARGISGDGSVVAGYGNTAAGPRAFRWTAGGGIVELPTFVGATDSYGMGTSSNGNAIAGFAATIMGERAFRWTALEGMQELPVLEGGMGAFGTAISGDGLVVVGYGDTHGMSRAFRWSAAGGVQTLGAVPGGFDSYAFGVNADGSVVAGFGGTPEGIRALRWVDGVPGSLGVISGCDASYGVGASADGLKVVGYCNSPGGNVAMMWTNELGIVDLNSYLPTLGVDLTGWALHEANAVSADGLAIAGFGRHNGEYRGWMVTSVSGCGPARVVGGPSGVSVCRGGTATISIAAIGTGPLDYQWRIGGSPIDATANPTAATATLEITGVSAGDAASYDCVVSNLCGTDTSGAAAMAVCMADYNCSGIVSVQDLFDFLAAYFAGDPWSDVNDSGLIGVQDIFDFMAAYFIGCV